MPPIRGVPICNDVSGKRAENNTMPGAANHGSQNSSRNNWRAPSVARLLQPTLFLNEKANPKHSVRAAGWLHRREPGRIIPFPKENDLPPGLVLRATREPVTAPMLLHRFPAACG
ncbi:hypothetical protein D3C86_1838340 [compost metagenome]